MITDRVIPPELKKKIKILVVEDNLLGRKLVSFMLKNWGFSFDVCGNGKLALEHLKINKYDLILMDIQMPEMNGYETTRYIREEMELGLPIIAMTSQVSEEERARCLSIGMNDYLAKPIKEEDMYNLTVNYLFATVVQDKENKLKNEAHNIQ
ncbi:MAG TPA: response regulator [Bacteroidia bacterium]|jgi:CheY-like chemotaxis protein|nr:response regulator [Bacteroidia bacterium]